MKLSIGDRSIRDFCPLEFEPVPGFLLLTE
jgi:hypothetical protein